MLVKRARSHLAAVGWKFVSIFSNGKRAMIQISPNGKSYYSLRKSCKVCMENSSIDVPSKPTKLHNVDIRSTHGVGLQHQSSQSLRTSEGPTKPKSNGGVAQPTHIPPRDRVLNNIHVTKPSHRNPRTVLCWLLENNVVSSRKKVCYYRSATLGDSSTVEGRITRDGIKCSCCKDVYSLSKFQEHLGGKCISNYSRGPASNIYLKDGRSLLDCQLQIMHDAKLRSLRTGKQPGMVQGKKLQGENDCVCSVCRYGGELILCDLCPSSFHQSCLKLAVVPDGDWFCPSCCCRFCSERSQKSGECTVDEHMINCT